MSDDEYGRVPAGWYPDPLGLPQLRWWDNHSWTEHVSDARQPMMPSPAAVPTMFADDEAQTRRGRRSTESAPTRDETPIAQPTAAVLRQLAPPSTTEPPPAAEPAASSANSMPSRSVPSASAPGTGPATSAADAFAAAAFADLHAQAAGATVRPPTDPWIPVQNEPAATPNPTASPAYGSPSYGSPAYGSPAYSSAPGANSAPGAPAFTTAWSESPVSASDPGRRGTHQTLGAGSTNVQTIEAWAIALLPMLQLLLSLLVVAAFSTGPSVVFMAAIWLGPLPIVVVLALLDARTLRRRGFENPFSGWWALLTAPIYLVGRAVRLSRVSGAGFGPVGVGLLLTGLVGASILAVPGLVIAAFPAAFAAEASNSIELNGRSLGTAMEVTCPPTPPLFIGQQLRCPAMNASGDNLVVTVSLQRSNGWIAWQVDDWGIFSIVR